jgi:hypothetical protein
MARHGAAYRCLLLDTPPPDPALLASGRAVPPGGAPLPRGGAGGAGTARGYLPRWRAGGRRRRGRGR